MANKLYPPTISGTLPAFCLEYTDSGKVLKGGTITVPFTMNASVGETQIKGFSLRLRTASSGSYVLPPIYSNVYSITQGEVIFGLTKSQAQNLNEGQYYKIQIAYCASQGISNSGELIGTDIGYYSTVGVAKCTSKPTVSIKGMAYENVNSFQNELFGLYDLTECNDRTEKVYSYEFIVYNEDDSIYMTSGEQLHKAYYDTEYTSSIDRILLNDFTAPDKIYSVQYKVITLNGLELYSPKYKVTSQFLVSPNAEIQILPEADVENGIITIHFSGAIDTEKSFYYLVDNAKTELLEINPNTGHQYQDEAGYTVKQAIALRLTGISNTQKLEFVQSHGVYRYYLPKNDNEMKFYYVFGVDNESTLKQLDDGKYYTPRVAITYETCPVEERDKLERYEKIIDGEELIISYSFDQVQNDIININDKTQYTILSTSQRERKYYGNYLLSRASDEDNYTTWFNIARFRLDDIVPSTYFIEDVTIEHGRKYKYGLQQYNVWGLYSARIVSEPFEASFEDMFLYDGEKSLRIRYNPEVSSFKTTILEQKTDTIGSQYPYITRNGATYYKEFPIAGLLAAELDTQLIFINPEKGDIHRHSSSAITKDIVQNAFRNYHDFSDSNIALERNFKLKVLEWLNNGKPKLFKSPYEGNYIVRLLNNSLTPIKELGRMLHNFSSTAYEIADCAYENLIHYGFLNVDIPSDYVGLWRTFNLQDSSLYDENGDIIIALDAGVQQFTIQDMMPGDIIYLKFSNSVDEIPIMIGITGSYTYEGTNNDEKLIQIRIPQSADHDLVGTINTFYEGVRITDFDSIIGMSLSTIISQQYIGVSPWMQKVKTIDWMAEDNTGFKKHHLQQAEYSELHNYNFRTFLKGRVNLQESSVMYDVTQEFADLIRSFDPGELLDRINLSINQNNRYKTELLNLEMIRFRQRPLVQVYWYSQGTSQSQVLPQYDSEQQIYGEYINSITQKTYNPNNNKWLVSTSPYGIPYPMDELLKTEMLDPFCMFQLNYYNYKTGNWERIPIDRNYSVYDPYYRTWAQGTKKYDPTVKIGYKWKRVVLPGSSIDPTEYDYELQQNVYNNNNYYYYYTKGEENPVNIIIDDYKYDVFNKYNDTTYIAVGNDFSQDIVYYIKDYDTILNLSTEKVIEYKDMPLANSYHIGNGVVVEATFQLRVVDYYTEIYDKEVRQAKENYLNAKQFYNDLMAHYNTINKSYLNYSQNLALAELYDRLLNGNSKKLADEYKQVIYKLQNENYFDYLELYKIYIINNYLSLPPINSLELINLLIEKKKEYQELKLSDEEICQKIISLEMYKYVENGITAYYLVDPLELITNYTVDDDEEDIMIYRFQNQNTKEVIYYKVYNHNAMINNYLQNNSSANVDNLIVMYNENATDNNFYVVDKTSTEVLLKGKFYQLERVVQEEQIPAETTRDYINLLNSKEYAALEFDEDFLYAIVNSTLESDIPITTSDDLTEKASIDGVLADNPLEGVNNKISALATEITNLRQQLNEKITGRNDAINNYAAALQDMKDGIEERNLEVYKSWIQAVLKSNKITVTNDNNISYDIPLDKIPNLLNDYLAEEVQQIEEQIQTEFDRYILIHYAVDYLSTIITDYLKTINLNNAMQQDLNDDDELDEYLNNQIKVMRGKVIFYLLAIRNSIEKQREGCAEDSILTAEEKQIISNNSAIDFQKYCEIFVPIFGQEPGPDWGDNSNSASYKIDLSNVNKPKDEDDKLVWINGVELLLDELVNNYDNISISNAKPDVKTMAELSNYYDDIDFLIQVINTYTTSTLEFDINQIQDPIESTEVENYNNATISTFNNEKHTDIYFYRKTLAYNQSSHSDDDDKENTLIDWANEYIEEKNGEIINNDPNFNKLNNKTNYTLEENPFFDFIFNPQINNKKDPAFTRGVGTQGNRNYSNNSDFYFNALTTKEKQKVLNINKIIINCIKINAITPTTKYQSIDQDTIDKYLGIDDIVEDYFSTMVKVKRFLSKADNLDIDLSIIPDSLSEFESLYLEQYKFLVYYFMTYYNDTTGKRNILYGDNERNPANFERPKQYTGIEKDSTGHQKVYGWQIPWYLTENLSALTSATYDKASKTGTIVENGIFYEYIKKEYDEQITILNKLLEQATKLLSLYTKLQTTYTSKLNTYLEEYAYNYEIYGSFAGTEAFQFYQYLNSDHTEEQKDQMITNYKNSVKIAWWLFISILDERYTEEKERGMYI